MNHYCAIFVSRFLHFQHIRFVLRISNSLQKNCCKFSMANGILVSHPHTHTVTEQIDEMEHKKRVRLALWLRPNRPSHRECFDRWSKINEKKIESNLITCTICLSFEWWMWRAIFWIGFDFFLWNVQNLWG